MSYISRRSPVVCRNGTVASSQPLATQIGIDILKAGGNAADAAVGVAAALNVMEPCSTGIGGDVFCLFYDAKTKTVKGLNGSGRAPGNLTLDLLNKEGFNVDNRLPVQHGHSVTVPGAAAAWVDAIDSFGSGKLTLSDILKPAIQLAETGVPIQQIASKSWEKGLSFLTSELNTHGKCMLIDGKTPKHGDVMKFPLLAQTFKELCNNGKKGFYEGRIAQAIVDVIEKFGGVMSLEDLKNHTSTPVDPISVDYKGYRVWEIPPNSQGITALIALNILEHFDLKKMGANSVEYLHTVTEAIKLSFADATWYCADPAQVEVPIKQLLSKDYAKKRQDLIHSDSVITHLTKGDLDFGKDTVYFTTADSEGNACSFINSNYLGFGTAIVPEGCGFTLHNRGCNFSLYPSHPNCIAPNKRPYHTIIPAMVTSSDTGELKASYGVMGGFMQPQGHVQVLLNMLEFGMNPQEALDQPRICVGGGYGFDPNVVSVEDGIPEDVVQGLSKLGHCIDGPVKGYSRSQFGRGQVITKGAWFKSENKTEDLYWAGSDPRGDGMAVGF